MYADPSSRQLYILDRKARQVIIADMDQGFALLNKVDLMNIQRGNLRGLAVHPTTHNLFVGVPAMALLDEFTPEGELVQRYDLSTLQIVDQRGLAFAPSADLTDAPEIIHLYIADSNLGASAGADGAVYGQVIEAALEVASDGAQPKQD
jgi:hypothetical protein